MTNPILIKRSAVAAKAPATTDLSLGELAINTVDGKLYLKKNVTGTETIVEVGYAVSTAQSAADTAIGTAAASDATAKVLVETNARIAADTAAIATAAIAADAKVLVETNARVTAVSGAIATAATAADAKVLVETNARIAADSAEVTARNAAITAGVVTSASKLTTARSIQGVSFDGTADITVTTAGTGITVTGTTIATTITQYTDTGARAALSATAPVAYNSTTGVISIAPATTTANGHLTAADWNTFNGKQAALGFTPYNATNPSAYVTAAVTLTTAAQPNITSTGTLTSLTTLGDVTVGGNLTVSGTTTTINSTTISVNDLNLVLANNAATAVAANGAGLTVNGAAATLTYTNADDRWNFNKNLNVTTVYGNVSGTAATITGTYAGSITSAQVTTGLGFTPYNSTNPSGYTTNLGTVTGVTATGPIASTGGTAPVISIPAATTSGAGYLTAADWNTFNGKQAALGFTPYNATNPSGYITSAGTATNISGTYAGSITSAQVTTGLGFTPYNATNPSAYVTAAVTLTTAAQAAITSVGSLTALTVIGQLNAGNAAVGGTLTVTGTSSASTIYGTNYVVAGVSTGLTAAGTTQATALLLAKEINVVATVAAGSGVVFPLPVAGTRIVVINTSATSLNVYPSPTGSGIINSLAANAAFVVPAGGKLEFVSVSATQWYTLNATFA